MSILLAWGRILLGHRRLERGSAHVILLRKALLDLLRDFWLLLPPFALAFVSLPPPLPLVGRLARGRSWLGHRSLERRSASVIHLREEVADLPRALRLLLPLLCELEMQERDDNGSQCRSKKYTPGPRPRFLL